MVGQSVARYDASQMQTLGSSLTWTQKYNTKGYVYGTKPSLLLLANATHIGAEKTGLAVADSEGRHSGVMAEQGLHVTAIDSSSIWLEKARRLAAVRGVDVDFQLADLRSWDRDANHSDLIAAVFIQFADPTFRAAIFDAIERGLKPSGILMMH